MCRRTLLNALLLAAVALTALSATASATRLSIADADGLASASGVLTLVSSGITTSCNVTLGLSLPRSITKAPSVDLAGLLPSGGGSTVAGCSGIMRSVVILTGVTKRYQSFAGTLPNIASITSVSQGSGFLVQFNSPVSAGCLYPTNGITVQLVRNIATRAITSATLSTPGTLTPTRLTAAPCPPAAKLSGTLTVLAPQPVVTLI